MFVRFVEAGERENAWQATGVITAAAILCSEDRLTEYERAVVEDAFAWFNAHLPCPPFERKRWDRAWSRDAVCWFLPQACEPIRRMWDLVAVLKEHAVPVRMFRTADPGTIVYRDPFQVVAETPQYRRRGR